MHQRYLDLTIVGQPDPRTIQVQTPANSKVAPRVYYMLFALTNQGVPSMAEWVRLL